VWVAPDAPLILTDDSITSDWLWCMPDIFSGLRAGFWNQVNDGSPSEAICNKRRSAGGEDGSGANVVDTT